MSPRWERSESAAGWDEPTGRGPAHRRDVGPCSSSDASSCRPPGSSLPLRQHRCCPVPGTAPRLPEMSNCSKAVCTWRSFSSCRAPIMQFICSCSPSPTSFMESCGERARHRVSIPKEQESWAEQLSAASPLPPHYTSDASYPCYIHFMQQQLGIVLRLF